MCWLVMQLWKFKPAVQKAVNASLRELKGLNEPTVAFHIRGGDLSADLQQNVSPSLAPPWRACQSSLLHAHTTSVAP